MAYLDQLIQDLRYGLRNLRKNPGFAAVAVLSLALGIMASTAMYSVLHAVVLDPFPYKDIKALMSVLVYTPNQPGGRTGYTTDQFLEIASRNTIFEATIASTISDVLWTGGGEPQRLRGNYVTSRTFETMGVPVLIGRILADTDYLPGSPPACVLGHRFWQRQFGGDVSVLGRTLDLNGTLRTVVGVMPPRFMWRGADVYVPVFFERGKTVEGTRFVHLLGRLKPGVTAAQAEGDLRPIIEGLARQDPAQFPEKWRVRLLSFEETFPSGIRDTLWILFGAVGLLLLIACANVSNLLLSRAAGRQREIAVRAALGAGRPRLIRQLLTESLLLASAGGTLGVLLAFAGLRAIISFVPPGTIPDESEIAVNTPVLLFATTISTITAFVFGLAPALHSSTGDLANPLREAGRSTSGGWRQVFLRNGFVVAEVALSLLLLVGATLMIRTLVAIEQVDLGIRTERLLTLRIPFSEKRYPDPARRAAFLQGLLDRLHGLPGVVSAGVNTWLHPFGNWGSPVEVSGSAVRDTRNVMVHQVNERYMATMGISLVQGRGFARDDMSARRHVALVNQTFVRRFAEDSTVLGRIARLPRLRPAPFNVNDDAFEIVGVVRDTFNRTVTNEISPEIYLPFTITGIADQVVVSSAASPAPLVSAIRAEVYALDKDQPVTGVQTLDKMVDEWIHSRPRFTLVLLSVFGALGLTLSAIGVYGVISNTVSSRTQEIGLRIALGAGFADVIAMIVGQGLRMVGIGIAVGLAISFAAVRLLERQIWNVSPFDPISFGAAALLLAVVGLKASFWPARRAARIDPVRALKYE